MRFIILKILGIKLIIGMIAGVLIDLVINLVTKYKTRQEKNRQKNNITYIINTERLIICRKLF